MENNPELASCWSGSIIISGNPMGLQSEATERMVIKIKVRFVEIHRIFLTETFQLCLQHLTMLEISHYSTVLCYIPLTGVRSTPEHILADLRAVSLILAETPHLMEGVLWWKNELFRGAVVVSAGEIKVSAFDY
jgi:hypothetical protein